jgi:hypothetical protein
VSARGSLNDKAWPKIPGFETFKGEVMHSAQWNDELVLSSDMLNVNSLFSDMTSRTSELGLLVVVPAQSRLCQISRRSKASR